jgi:hypothetical protein
MPSPFPGMDPYLEDPRLWVSVHNRLISLIDDALTARVRPHFYVEQQSAVYIVEPGSLPRPPIMPDVYLVETGRPRDVTQSTLVAERPITTPTIMSARFPEEIRQRFLEIRDATSHAVVTVIEILSPTNKAAGASGRRSFVDKRRDVMSSPVHWLEIDLLRAGERPEQVEGLSDYYALLKRGGDSKFEIWFWNLRDPAPVIAVPLTPSFPDMALDLQATLTAMFDRYYADRMDYGTPPPLPRLLPADAAWVEQQVGAWRAVRSAE